MKKKLGCKLFTITLYFNSSQYYPTLDKTLAIKLCLHLICFIIRMCSCNINPHFVNLWFLFCTLWINVTVLWSVITTNGWNVHQNAFFFNFGLFFLIFVILLRNNSNSAKICLLYLRVAKLLQTPRSLVYTVNIYPFEKVLSPDMYVFSFLS